MENAFFKRMHRRNGIYFEEGDFRQEVDVNYFLFYDEKWYNWEVGG